MSADRLSIYRYSTDVMNLPTYLAKLDRLSYIDIIQPIEEGTARILIADESGILIKINDATFAVAVFDEHQVERFAQALLPFTSHVAVHEGPLLEYFLSEGLQPSLRCIQAVYTSNEFLPVDSHLTIRPIEEADIELVLTYYKHADEAYIRERVHSQTMIGIEIDGSLAAFMGRHSEGTMGLLEVLPQYRRRHLGQELEKAYINRLLAQNLVPFCHVESENTASLALQRKLGLVFADQRIYWFG